MKYHEIIAETIPTRPGNLAHFLKTRIKALQTVLDSVAQADDLLTQSRDGEDLITQAMRYGSEDEELRYLAYPQYLAEFHLDRYYLVADLRHDLQAYLDYGKNFLDYILGTLSRVRPAYDEVWNQIKLLPGVEAGLETYGYKPGDPENDKDEEYVAALSYLKGLRLKAQAIEAVARIEANIQDKLGAIVDLRNFGYSGKNPEHYRPKHEEVETLFHATLYLPEILRDGFAAEKPEGRMGVGNFGSQNLISFTHSYEIAHAIARAFKELWMIAHGQLSGRQIVRWCEAEGIDIQKSWQSNEGRKPLPLTPNSPPSLVAKLFRLYLWNTKLRSNPVLVNIDDLMDAMQQRKLSDIGILAAEVRLTAEQMTYHWAESEFRVPASHVLSVKQVY
jgi:hypothetical protein